MLILKDNNFKKDILSVSSLKGCFPAFIFWKNFFNIDIMKDEYIRKKWEDFTNKYKHLFLSNNEEWSNNLILLKIVSKIQMIVYINGF